MVKFHLDLVGINLLIVFFTLVGVFWLTQKWQGWARFVACVGAAAAVAYLSGNISASYIPQ